MSDSNHFRNQTEPSSTVGIHPLNFENRIWNLFERGELSDLTVLVGKNKEKIKAHKIVLAAASPVFKNYFTGGAIEDELIISTLDPHVFRSFLKFLYTGEESFTTANVIPVMSTARYYEVQKLVTVCEKLLKNALAEESALVMYQQAIQYDEKDIQEVAKKIVCRFGYKIIDTVEFLKASEDCLLNFLGEDDLRVRSEVQVFDALIRWAIAKCKRQGEVVSSEYCRSLLEKLIPLIRFPQMEEGDFALKVAHGQIQVLTEEECLSVLFYHKISTELRSEVPPGLFNSRPRRYIGNVSFKASSVGTVETESEIEEWSEQTDHPLLHEEILSTLFDLMGRKELMKCRLVCKKWCVLTLPSVRSTFSFKLKGNDEEISRRLTEFVDVFRLNTLGIPFDMYDLDPFCTTEEPGQEFLRICGSTARKVDLSQPYPQVSTVHVEDISELLKSMPNLELFAISHNIRSRSGRVIKLFPDESSAKPTLTSLKRIYVYDRNPERTIDYCPTFIEEIVSIAPNISTCSLQDFNVYDPNRSRIGQVLKAIKKFGRESVIRDLCFTNASSEHFEPLLKLGENGMKLKSFSFSRIFKRVEEYYSTKFLPPLATHFKDSIEDLYVDEICNGFMELPHMPQLKTLKLCTANDFDSKCVNFSDQFSALEELELCSFWNYGFDNEWKEFLPNTEPCPNVKSLSLQWFVMRIQLFDHILNIFPKLTKLELVEIEPDAAQILRKVMTQMTQLEGLCVSGTIEGIESIDAFWTGIPVQGLQQLEHVVTELKEMSAQLRAETIRHYRTRYCQFPSITDLTNLKQLDLDTTGRAQVGEQETQMTDLFLFFGLHSMKHINKLAIANCEFTKAGCEILTTEMELDTWSFLDDDTLHIIPEVQ